MEIKRRSVSKFYLKHSIRNLLLSRWFEEIIVSILQCRLGKISFMLRLLSLVLDLLALDDIVLTLLLEVASLAPTFQIVPLY